MAARLRSNCARDRARSAAANCSAQISNFCRSWALPKVAWPQSPEEGPIPFWLASLRVARSEQALCRRGGTKLAQGGEPSPDDQGVPGEPGAPVGAADTGRRVNAEQVCAGEVARRQARLRLLRGGSGIRRQRGRRAAGQPG